MLGLIFLSTLIYLINAPSIVLDCPAKCGTAVGNYDFRQGFSLEICPTKIFEF